MRTAEELDQMHEAIVAKYPGGINFEQYNRVVLESADEDGKVYPHSLANWFTQQSALMKMMFDGLITHRGRHDEPFNWHITDKGRDAVTNGDHQ